MRRVLGRGLQRAHDHLIDLLVGDRPRPPRPRLVEQPIQTLLGEPVAPLGHHRTTDPEPLGDLGVLEPVGGREHDPRALRQRLRSRPTPRPRLKLRALLAGQRDLNSNRRRHAPTPPPAATELNDHDTRPIRPCLRWPCVSWLPPRAPRPPVASNVAGGTHLPGPRAGAHGRPPPPSPP